MLPSGRHLQRLVNTVAWSSLVLATAVIVGLETNGWMFLAVLAAGFAVHRVATAPQRRRRRDRARLRAAVGSSRRLSVGWARLVQRAWRARDSMHASVTAVPAGPRRDRLQAAAQEMDECLVEAGRVARLGSALQARSRQLSVPRLARQVRRARQALGAADADVRLLERQAIDGRRLAEELTRIRLRLEIHVNTMESVAADAALTPLQEGALNQLLARSDRLRERLAGLRAAAAEVERVDAGDAAAGGQPTGRREQSHARRPGSSLSDPRGGEARPRSARQP